MTEASRTNATARRPAAPSPKRRASSDSKPNCKESVPRTEAFSPKFQSRKGCFGHGASAPRWAERREGKRQREGEKARWKVMKKNFRHRKKKWLRTRSDTRGVTRPLSRESSLGLGETKNGKWKRARVHNGVRMTSGNKRLVSSVNETRHENHGKNRLKKRKARERERGGGMQKKERG